MDVKKKQPSTLRETEQDVLRRHWKTLKTDIRMADIVDPLIEQGVLTPHEWEDIKRRNHVERDRTEDFLHFLMRKSSEDYHIFLNALKENGFKHIFSKLERSKQNRKDVTSKEDSDITLPKEPNVPSSNHNFGSAVDMKALWSMMVEMKHNHGNNVQARALWRKGSYAADNNDKKENDLYAYKKDQEERVKAVEKSLRKSLKNTNEEVLKLKDTLHLKELEIGKLIKKQKDQEQRNEDLNEDNRRLIMEREKTNSELNMSQYSVDEVRLQMKKAQMEKEQMQKDNQLLTLKIERQHTIIQDKEEQLERDNIELETARMEKDELHTKIRQLEDENERFSMSRPQTSMSTFSDETGYQRSRFSRRPSPTGLSISADKGSLASSDRFEDRVEEIEELKTQILKKQKEQDDLRKSLQVLQKSKSTDKIERIKSEICVLQ